jgi:beta-mannanase
VSWADVAQGKYDDTLSAQARGVASLKKPVFVTFEQEANQRVKLGVAGDAAEFKAAWRHLHDLYRQAGATNAVWTWVMTGNASNLNRAASLWPGNDVVDWISWNVYNQSGCPTGDISTRKFVSFDQKLSVFYQFLQTRGPALGIDTSKPLMLSEVGSAHYPGYMSLTAGWYLGIPPSLQAYPNIKAVALWNSVDGSCDYRVTTDPTLSEAVGKMGQLPPFDATFHRKPSR